MSNAPRMPLSDAALSIVRKATAGNTACNTCGQELPTGEAEPLFPINRREPEAEVLPEPIFPINRKEPQA